MKIFKKTLSCFIAFLATCSFFACSPVEVEGLFEIINKLRSNGVSIIYISHKMEEILKISDEVTIMRDGTYVGTWDSKELTTDLIIQKMVGRELTDRFPKREKV